MLSTVQRLKSNPRIIRVGPAVLQNDVPIRNDVFSLNVPRTLQGKPGLPAVLWLRLQSSSYANFLLSQIDNIMKEKNFIYRELIVLEEDKKHLGSVEEYVVEEYIKMLSPNLVKELYEGEIQVYRDLQTQKIVVWNRDLMTIVLIANDKLLDNHIKGIVAYFEYVPNFKSFEEYKEDFLKEDHNVFDRAQCKYFLSKLLGENEKIFDFSLESVKYLDKVLNIEDIESVKLEKYIFSFGYYIGETLVKNKMAEWQKRPSGSSNSFPLLIVDKTPTLIYSRMYKCLTSDHGDLIPPSVFMFSLIKPIFQPIKSKEIRSGKSD